jgi:cardiolipin synthase
VTAPASTRFSARDLLLPPNLLSLLRVPLAVAFPLARTPAEAFAVLALAGLSDTLDGWLARRNGQVTAIGAVVDPVTDKMFAIAVVGTLIARGHLPAWAAPALLTREMLEAPLAAWILVRHFRDGEPLPPAQANKPGKMATSAQFAAVLTALVAPRATPVMLAVAGAAGIAAGVAYWKREIERMGAAKTPA